MFSLPESVTSSRELCSFYGHFSYKMKIFLKYVCKKDCAVFVNVLLLEPHIALRFHNILKSSEFSSVIFPFPKTRRERRPFLHLVLEGSLIRSPVWFQKEASSFFPSGSRREPHPFPRLVPEGNVVRFPIWFQKGASSIPPAGSRMERLPFLRLVLERRIVCSPVWF